MLSSIPKRLFRLFASRGLFQESAPVQAWRRLRFIRTRQSMSIPASVSHESDGMETMSAGQNNPGVYTSGFEVPANRDYYSRYFSSVLYL